MKRIILATLTLLLCFTGLAYTPNPTVQLDPSNLSAFGTLEVGELTPVIQLDWVYGINSQTGTSNVLNGGILDTSNGRLRLQSGTNPAASSIFQSKRPIKYRAGQGVTARFTVVLSPPATNNIQEIGIGNEVDGYFFGYYTNAQFGIIYRLNSTNTFIPQSAWNVDKCDGTGLTNTSRFNWNPTNGNVCMVKYPFLGYGAISFYVQNPVTARFINVHNIQYPNTSQAIQISNPNLSFYARTINIGSTNPVTMYSGSAGIFLSGQRSFVSNPKWAINSSLKANIGNTELPILTLKNCTNYNGVINRSLIRVNSITVAAGATASTPGSILINVRINPTLTGPVYNAINGTTNLAGGVITAGNSITTYDTAATATSGGNLIFNFVGIALTQNVWSLNQIFDLTPFDIYVAPGDILTITCTSAGATSSAIVAITWTEDI